MDKKAILARFDKVNEKFSLEDARTKINRPGGVIGKGPFDKGYWSGYAAAYDDLRAIIENA